VHNVEYPGWHGQDSKVLEVMPQGPYIVVYSRTSVLHSEAEYASTSATERQPGVGYSVTGEDQSIQRVHLRPSSTRWSTSLTRTIPYPSRQR